MVEEIALFEPGGAPVTLAYATSIAFRGDELLVLEGGRYHFASPFNTNLASGRLRSIALSGDEGTVSTLAEGLKDPIGLAVNATGTVFFTQYGEISILNETGAAVSYTTGLPSQRSDFVFVPVTDQEAGHELGQGDLLDLDTTGTMGLAFAADGTLYALEGINGRPPDDPFTGERSYSVDYSSSLLTPGQGAVDPSMVYARGCRNCLDLAIAPAGHPKAGVVYATENMGVYRARLQAGEERTVLQGSSAADANHMDDIVEVSEGNVRRAATVVPDSASLGAVPAGIAFAPSGFPAGGPSRMFVTVYSGLPESAPEDGADDRAYVAFVEPERQTGLGPVVPFAVGFDFAIDLAFGPDGSMYVLEYFSGRLFRIAPDGG
ncbi:MAG: hypothetical protein HY556_02215 [Euryarchaeota archaeon]|nr:hypothetical protein [Euryarchaeota archaeon]